jgi:hypothetical protein
VNEFPHGKVDLFFIRKRYTIKPKSYMIHTFQDHSFSFGTFNPASLASLMPIAIACLRFLGQMHGQTLLTHIDQFKFTVNSNLIAYH